MSWLTEANVNIRTSPTAEAVEQDQTSWYDVFSLQFKVEAYYWWLREPVPDTASNCYIVNNGYTSKLLRDDMPVGLEGIGVRPVVKIDTKKITLSYRKSESSDSQEQEDSAIQEEEE